MSARHLLAALLCAAPALARAQASPVPYVLAHHGRLLSATDTAIDGQKDVTFELHTTDNPQLKQPKWKETLKVDFRDGLYGVLLGDTRANGTALDLALLSEPELFVSITLDGIELQPRLRIPSVPYSLRAARAAEAERVLANGVDTAALKDGAVTLAKLALTDGRFAGLNADQLDGLDSSAFAPASIEAKIDTLGTNLTAFAGAVGGLEGSTLAGSVTGVHGKLDTLAGDLGGVKADTTALKADTTALKADTTALKSDTTALKSDTTALKSDTTTLKSDTTTLKSDASTLKSDASTLKADASTLKSDTTALKADATTLKADTATIKADGTLLKAALLAMSKSQVAQARYSTTCNPATDTFLREAYPGLDDAAVKDVCVRDGRWHLWGTVMDVIKATPLPAGAFQFAVTNYSGQLQPATLNGWNRGLRLCYGPTAVGDTNVIVSDAMVIQCVAVTPITADAGSNKLFTVTHKLVDSGTNYYIQRTYTPAGAEVGSCTTSGGGWSSCGNSESSPGFWQVWLRQ